MISAGVLDENDNGQVTQMGGLSFTGSFTNVDLFGRGTISLNWRLVQTPAFVRDYIALHELAHLKEMNHSRRFWREVARLCPEFKQAEQWLKEHSSLLA